MDKLTLDTNILRDWAWCDGKDPTIRHGNDEATRLRLARLFEDLKALRDSGECQLGITTQVFTDHPQTRGKLPQHIGEMIGPHVILAGPSIFTLPFIGPYVLAEVDVIEGIFRAVFPQSKEDDKKYQKNRQDALQLYAHRVAGRDCFVTADTTILAKRSVLAEDWGIQVRSLDEYISSKTQV